MQKALGTLVLSATVALAAVPLRAQVFSENGGVVVFEAEDFSNTVARSDHAWVFTNDIAGFSGTGFMQALPDNGSNISVNITSTSPELQYRANFGAAGTRYVWVRGYGADPNSDS